ncbi:thioredoxin [Anaerobacillus alkaliphilus]|uniref:Thioredoxin n=1 Tax=Anaerobacillus alkaliphilus TaxID=1548597 RepID=A0A4V1LG56_9BACI|nr:thioredoxin family protein [Anaerobacillus alkaliphilus]RXI98594.1 thioredoxin [Anaerobacillus alkaliphilus]
MKVLESKDMYKSQLQTGLSVVMFSANWCPDCVVIQPVLPEIEEKFSQFTFYYADRDKLIDLCVELEVFGIPSFIAYHNGEEIDRFVSKDRKTKEEIEKFLQDTFDKLSK